MGRLARIGLVEGDQLGQRARLDAVRRGSGQVGVDVLLEVIHQHQTHLRSQVLHLIGWDLNQLRALGLEHLHRCIEHGRGLFARAAQAADDAKARAFQGLCVQRGDIVGLMRVGVF